MNLYTTELKANKMTKHQLITSLNQLIDFTIGVIVLAVAAILMDKM